MNSAGRENLTITHDDACPHNARTAEAYLQANSIGRIPQPAFSPDMNLLDRFVLRNMENERRDRVFVNIQDAQESFSSKSQSMPSYRRAKEATI